VHRGYALSRDRNRNNTKADKWDDGPVAGGLERDHALLPDQIADDGQHKR
jgi:hypothetical protein